MKILLVCQQSPHTYPIPAYGFWRTYFVNGLREAGHEIVEVPDADWARGLLPLAKEELTSWRDEIWSRTIALARATPKLDLFLSYLYPQQIEPAAVRSLNALGIPTVNFFCDNVREFRRLPAAFAPFHAHWVPEYDALPLYTARGWRNIFAPMPCWVPPVRRQTPGSEVISVSFVGRRDILRAELLEKVAGSGLPLAIYGANWTTNDEPRRSAARPTWRARAADWAAYYRRQGLRPAWRRLTGKASSEPGSGRFDFQEWAHPSLSEQAYADVLACSAVTLGINRFAVGEIGSLPRTYSRLRDIEAPMHGACYLTEATPELPRLYDVGQEVESFSNAEELVEKAHALLAEPSRRQTLRAAGQRRALTEHTVGASLGKIGRQLGLPHVAPIPR